MKKILLLALSFIIIETHARPYPDKVAVCYIFKKDKLIKTGVCVKKKNSAAGGYWSTHLTWGNDEFNLMHEDYYYRDNSFYEKITLERAHESGSEVISCSKYKKIDICHN